MINGDKMSTDDVTIKPENSYELQRMWGTKKNRCRYSNQRLSVTSYAEIGMTLTDQGEKGMVCQTIQQAMRFLS